MRSWNVRRFVAAMATTWALMTVVAVADEQPAAAPATAPADVAAVATTPTVPAAPVQRVHRVSRRPAQQSFFQRVMELERRKNAWLMRTFLGR